MNPSNPLQTQPEIGNDYYYEACVVSPNAHHQYIEAPLLSIDHVAKPLPNAAQTLEDQHFEEPESQEPNLDSLTQVGHRQIRLFARQLKEYINKVHLIAVMAAIQYSGTPPDTNLQNQDVFSLTLKAKMMIVIQSFRTIQRPPSSQKIILESSLTVQYSTGHHKCATTLNFVFVHVQFIPNHGGKKMRY
jgi:hypothetical protein